MIRPTPSMDLVIEMWRHSPSWESGGGPRAHQDAGAFAIDSPIARSVLDCASPLAFWDGGVEFGSTSGNGGNTVWNTKVKKATAFQWLVVLGALSCVCLAFVIAILYYSCGWNTSRPNQTVEVSTNLPASLLNANLHLKVREPSDLLATNHESLSGDLSLAGPDFGGSSDDEKIEKWDEMRLIAINAEGFEVRFTKRWRLSGLGQKMNQETNVILFRYGQVTETNALGWKIVGKFK